MASAFSHALVGYTLGKTFQPVKSTWKYWLLVILLPAMPDLDIISFNFGIPYEHPLGHRGFTHSFLFAFIFALLVKWVFFNTIEWGSRKSWMLIILIFVIIASHGILDAMTTGGRGSGFFIPFSNERYFLPWRFIKVSPMDAGRFFSDWGVRVLKNEFVYIGIPCFIILGINKLRQLLWVKTSN